MTINTHTHARARAREASGTSIPRQAPGLLTIISQCSENNAYLCIHVSIAAVYKSFWTIYDAPVSFWHQGSRAVYLHCIGLPSSRIKLQWPSSDQVVHHNRVSL